MTARESRRRDCLRTEHRALHEGTAFAYPHGSWASRQYSNRAPDTLAAAKSATGPKVPSSTSSSRSISRHFSPRRAKNTDPLASVVNKYSVCGAAVSVETMTLEDALDVARYLHAHLYFKFYPPMDPGPYIGDVLDACDLASSDDTTEFHTFCERLRQSDTGGMGIEPTDGPAGGDLAFRLNQLYGQTVSRYYPPVAPELCGLPADPAACSAPGPRYFYNPKTATCEERPFASCGPALADFSTLEACRSSCSARVQSCQCTGGACLAGDCTECPVTSTSSAACSNPGLYCQYRTAGSSTCTCTADGTWTCWGSGK